MYNKLKYPLTNQEIKDLDKAWEFLNIFKKPYIFVSDYRDYLIKKINEKYNVDTFFYYENILNKLFWNLRWAIYPYWIEEHENSKIDNLPNSLLLCDQIKYDTDGELEKIIKDAKLNLKNYYRSFINKLIIVNKQDKTVYIKNMEGSSDIFSKNYFNLFTMSILFKPKLYEKIMENPEIIKKENVELSKYYFQYDYGFPNINYCTYSIGDDNVKKDRIKKMYFNGDGSKWWFKIIKI